MAKNVSVLMELGHGDVARLFAVASEQLRLNRNKVVGRRGLTKSEQEVLRLLAAGLIPKEIATETGRSLNTVRVHIAKASEKLGCHGQTQAIMAARDLGLI